MVLTEEEKKQKRKEYREKNKEKRKEYLKNNKEKITQQTKEYRENSKEKRKEYCERNKEKIAQQTKEYYQTPVGKKIIMISQWKSRGLIHDNYEELYDRYLQATGCDVCKYVFDETNWRCMDHDHTTGLFRQFLCHRCNVYDNWKKVI